MYLYFKSLNLKLSKNYSHWNYDAEIAVLNVVFYFRQDH